MTVLYSAFPGTGKTYYFSNTKKKVLDSDSSTFDKSEFPNNYIKHIQDSIGKVDEILISSHEEVRNALVKAGLEFTLIYPDISLKDEYVKRYKDRESPEAFIKLLEVNWNEWIEQLILQDECEHIVLQSGEYISDVILDPMPCPFCECEDVDIMYSYATDRSAMAMVNCIYCEASGPVRRLPHDAIRAWNRALREEEYPEGVFPEGCV